MSKHLSTSVRVPIEADNPSIVRNESLCIKCGQCRNVCTSPVGVLGTYALEQTGDRAICIHCGQCANVCPVGSITEVYEYPEVKAAVQDNKPYPLSRTFLREREKQQFLPEPLLLSFY